MNSSTIAVSRGLVGAHPAHSAPVERMLSAVKPLKPSLWLWLPYVWLFIISTRSLDIWVGGLSEDATAIDPDLSGAPIDRAVMTALMGISMFVLVKRRERVKAILLRNKCLVLLFLYILASITWSNFPGISFRRATRVIGMVMVLLVALTEEDRLEALRKLLLRLYWVIIPVSILTIKYFRNIGVAFNWSGIEEQWTGLTTHKNCLGQVAMCTGLLCVWQILRKWPNRKLTTDLALLIATLWVLRGSPSSHSSTAIVGFITSAVVLVALQVVKKRAARAKRIILAGTVTFILFVPFVYLGFEAFDTTPVELVLQATGRDLTLTDRTILWTDVLNNADKNPVLGVGYGAFWVGHIGYDLYPLPNWDRKTPWRPHQGHNGYIDVFTDLGFVGLTLVLVLIGIAFAGALSDLQADFQLGSLRLALLLSIVMNNLTEASLLKGTHSLWFLFLLVAINVPRWRKHHDSGEPVPNDVRSVAPQGILSRRRTRAVHATSRTLRISR